MSEYDRQSAELTKSILSLPKELQSQLLSGMSWDEIKKRIPGSVEAALAMGSGAYGNIAGGWANIAGTAGEKWFGGPPGQGDDWQQRTQDMLTYQPADARVPKLLELAAVPDEASRAVGGWMGNVVDAFGGGPGAVTAAETLPVAAMAVAGIGKPRKGGGKGKVPTKPGEVLPAADVLSASELADAHALDATLAREPVLSPVEEAAAAAADARNPTRSRRRVGTTGQYVGAPPGVDTPQALAAIVRRYKNAMLQGFPGREFYNLSSEDIYARAGQNVERADQFGGNLALLSRANTVGGNAAMSTKGHIQAITGAPVETGRFPARDSPAVAALYDSSRVTNKGLKREPFAEQLAVKWAPERIGRGVNDMHEAELMGYAEGTVGGPTQHAFMDEVRARAIAQANREKLGGVSDWNTGTAQAAAWTGNKIRRGDLKPGDAALSYADYLPRQEVNATYESAPGVGTGHLQNLPTDTPSKQAFHDDPRGSWKTSPSGRDIGYTEAGLLPGADVAAAGHFEGVVNPATVARPLAGTENIEPVGPRRPRPALLEAPLAPGELGPGRAMPGLEESPAKTVARMPPSVKPALNLVEGSRAFFDVQNAGAWHKLYDSDMSQYNGAHLVIPGMTEAQMRAIAPHFENKGYIVASAPDGLSIISADGWGPAFGKAFKDDVTQTMKNAGYKKPQLQFGRAETGYIDFSEGWKQPPGSGVATSQLLELAKQSPEVAARMEASARYRDTVEARTARDVEARDKGGGDLRWDAVNARLIFQKFGWDGLRAAVNKGLVPMAAALTVGGAGSQLLSDYEPPAQ